MKKVGVVIAVALALSGCGKPKIDASNDETMKASIQKVRQSLPEDKRVAYDNALELIVFGGINFRHLMQPGADASSVKDGIKNQLSGKTGEDVISYADNIRKVQAEKDEIQARQEIAELENKKIAAELSANKLKAFKVLRSRFYFEKREFGRDQPIISLSVENSTDKAISRAYFKGVLTSSGRSVPWYTDTFSYQISGGLEPGEKASWNLAPNPYSDWGSVDAPADAIFTVTVMRIDDAEGKPIFGDSEFTEQDAHRLDRLKNKYPDINK